MMQSNIQVLINRYIANKRIELTVDEMTLVYKMITGHIKASIQVGLAPQPLESLVSESIETTLIDTRDINRLTDQEKQAEMALLNAPRRQYTAYVSPRGE